MEDLMASREMAAEGYSMRPSGLGSLWRRIAVPWRLWRLTTGSTTRKCWRCKDMLPHHPDWTDPGRIVAFLHSGQCGTGRTRAQADAMASAYLV